MYDWAYVSSADPLYCWMSCSTSISENLHFQGGFQVSISPFAYRCRYDSKTLHPSQTGGSPPRCLLLTSDFWWCSKRDRIWETVRNNGRSMQRYTALRGVDTFHPPGKLPTPNPTPKITPRCNTVRSQSPNNCRYTRRRPWERRYLHRRPDNGHSRRWQQCWESSSCTGLRTQVQLFITMCFGYPRFNSVHTLLALA